MTRFHRPFEGLCTVHMLISKLSTEYYVIMFVVADTCDHQFSRKSETTNLGLSQNPQQRMRQSVWCTPGPNTLMVQGPPSGSSYSIIGRLSI